MTSQWKIRDCYPSAVNPGAARVLNQVCCSEGCTNRGRLSSSSAADGTRHPATRYWTYM